MPPVGLGKPCYLDLRGYIKASLAVTCPLSQSDLTLEQSQSDSF